MTWTIVLSCSRANDFQGNTMTATAVKERPILFSGPMVRAILDGRKTMTRRVVQPQPIDCEGDGDSLLTFAKNLRRLDGEHSCMVSLSSMPLYCPYGNAGERLWVRETWLPLDSDHYHERGQRDRLIANRKYPLRNGAAYAAETIGDSDSERCRIELGYKWKSPIHMPRWASRLTLEITDVRIERLQDISEEDAKAEGVEAVISKKISGWTPHVLEICLLWEKINGIKSWDANPWVWVVSFKRA